MNLRATVLALALAGLAAGCGAGDDATAGDAAAAMPGRGPADGPVEWRGSMPCSDCEGIDTRLVLGHADGERVYELVEVYLAVDGSMRFEEAGQWQLDEAVLSLEPRTGGLRRYGVVAGGALQVRDLRGRAFPGRETDVLLPAGRHH